MAEKTTAVTTAKQGVVALKESLNTPATMESFKKLLGNRANGFVSALISIVGNSDLLRNADTNSIILAAGQSAAMNLPINPSLGMAGIVPYWDNNKKTYVAQLQVMRDGWVELAQRSGQIAQMANEIVYEGELVKIDRFRNEYDFSGHRTSNRVIGYMAYTKTISGFEKVEYMTVEECLAHAKRYSGQFKKDGKGLWKDQFDAMALKTVLKKLIKKYLPKSTEMIMAIESDQAIFTNGEVGNATPEYADNAQNVQEVEVVDVDAEVIETPQE